MRASGMVNRNIRPRRDGDTKMRVCGIYKIMNKINGMYYVGSSKDVLGKRWYQHRKRLTDKTHHNPHLINAWHKYGAEAFEIVIIEEVPEDKLYEVEQKYLSICEANPSEAYNMNYSPDGGKPCAETLAKISRKLKGRVFTEEHKKRIGIAITGRFYSAETRAKIGKYSSTRVHGEETRRKIGASLLGGKRSDETKARMRAAILRRGGVQKDETIRVFRNQTTEEIFEGTRRAFIQRYGLNRSSVCHLVRGKTEAVRGWRMVSPVIDKAAA
jgi:group I intron endonuclease